MSGTPASPVRKPARRVFLSQLPYDSHDDSFWVQGVVVSLEGQHCQIDDGTAVATVHCEHLVESGTVKWESIQVFNYVLAVVCPFVGGLNAIRLIDLTENPNRELIWILETMAQQKGLRV